MEERHNERETSLLFLDFDGVICDSVNECFASSWLAYHGIRRLSEAADRTIALGGRSTFAHYRPFIRRGADYVLLQQCVDRGIVLQSQQDFDGVEQSVGEKGLAEINDRFYAARRMLLSEARHYWLRLNVVYPAVRDHLAPVGQSAYILTTKEADFVAEILNANGIDWNRKRIVCTGRSRKADFIAAELDRAGAHKAIFIDDQIDHLSAVDDSRIEVHLASWGYVRSEWLAGAQVPVMKIEEFVSLLRNVV